jgi:hypothetical protein
MMSETTERLEALLAAIGTAIAAGTLDDAKQLSVAIPQYVSPGGELSQQIGDLYLELGLTVMAGRYWYLLEDKSDQMVIACEEFERSLGHNPRLILEAMGWCRERSPYARASLTELVEQSIRIRREHQHETRPPRGLQDRAFLLGCAVVSLAIMFVFVMGITSIVHMF